MNAARRDNPVVLTVLLWLLVAGGMILNTAMTGRVSLSTDDAMRLAEVQDLIAGQNWFDTAQYRMNTPFGLPMHWSHLIDAGIAGLIWLFRLVTDAKAAETWAVYVWPVLPMLPALLAASHIGARLAGRVGGLFALAIAASCDAGIAPFRPGAIDHHNVQLALSLWFVACLVDFRRTKWAAPAAAAFACLSLAIGLETLPYVVVGIAIILVQWITAGDQDAAGVRRFAIAMTVASVAILCGATASAYRLEPACDMFSLFYAASTVVGGLVLFVVTSLRATNATPTRRVIGVYLLGLAVAGTAAIVGPECLGGPYAALDPRIIPIWLARTAETQTPFEFAAVAPGDFFASYGYAVLAVLAVLGAVAVVPRDKRRDTITLAVFAVSAFIIATWQIRALTFALLFAMPGVAAFVVHLITRFRMKEAWAAITFVVSLFAASNATYAYVANRVKHSAPPGQRYYEQQEAWQKSCLSREAMAPLAALPRGRVLAFVDQGPAILAFTHHAAVSGPYHRNASGILDTYAAFTGTADGDAARIVAERQINYVVFCTSAPDAAYYREQGGPRSFIAALIDNRPVNWLSPIPSSNGMRVYRVLLDRLR